MCENDEYVRFLKNLRILVLKYIDLINMLFGWENYYSNLFENISIVILLWEVLK